MAGVGRLARRAATRLERSGQILMVLIWLGVLAQARGPAPAAAGTDWPQFARDAQRSNASTDQVDPPYCHAWKWYGVPIASRAQPVVSGGRLLVGGMDGVLYARSATSGAALWQFPTGGPIRHSPAVLRDLVITGSHDGNTYGVAASDGRQLWRTATGPSVTAPVVDEVRDRVFVASSDGTLTALTGATGSVIWKRDLGAPILVSPSLSTDSSTVLVGSEAIEAVAVDSATGAVRWRTPLQGQSLADRAPLVVNDLVVYRTQPVDYFPDLLHAGDDVMDQAGPVQPDWAADWNAVRPRIQAYMTEQPSKRTIFVLDVQTGTDRGVVPVLYTHGGNDTPSAPVGGPAGVFVPYRARHGIQTDGGSVHVTSRYDAELGRLDLESLDVLPLGQLSPRYAVEFRLTSDEPAQLTIGGDWLVVDNWERIGAYNIRTGALAHLAAVSNDWPECFVQCGPGSAMPFFPMSGSGPAYPFPSPRVTEGHQRAGAAISNGMIYWKVAEGGLLAVSHREGASCPAPIVHAPTTPGSPRNVRFVPQAGGETRPLRDYVWNTVQTRPAAADDPLVSRLRKEVRDLVSPNEHLLPMYVQRGFSSPRIWPAHPAGEATVTLAGSGTVYWHDPGELLYTLAASFPYLDPTLQADVRAFVTRETTLYPPLQDLPWWGLSWLKEGAARERYPVPLRSSLSNWPPPGATLAAIYGVWRWVDVTGDRNFAEAQWPAARALFGARRGAITFYADIAGAIGYARLAHLLGDAAAAAEGESVAVEAMTRLLDFDSCRQRADATFKDPRDQATGWSMPVFFGLTPEVGWYLRERLEAPAMALIRSKQEGDAMRWWYLTRVGVHGEIGETSYLAPITAWSHFLARAYVGGAPRSELERWLDRSWGRGDVYSLQKLVATIEAP